MTDFITNLVTLDWLTLTSYKAQAYSDMLELVLSVGGVKQAKRLQYVGHQNGKNGFIGQGEQKEKLHYMAQLSGLHAHELGHFIITGDDNQLANDWACSRLDVQLTRFIPDYTLKGWEWVARGKGRKISHVSEAGLDTVYMGSRKSDEFIRVYVKDDQRGTNSLFNGQFIRVEFELKGEKAKQAWVAIRSGKLSTYDVWRDCWGAMIGEKKGRRGWADVICPTVLYHFSLPIGKAMSYDRRKSNTMAWLHNQVDSAVKKMLLDHDNAPDMIGLIGDWSRMAGQDTTIGL